MNIKKLVRDAVIAHRRESFSKIALLDDEKLTISNKTLPSLSRQEKSNIIRVWGDLLNNSTIDRGLIYYRICKQLRSFDVMYVPAAYYVPYICFVLNNRNYIKNFVHKSLIDLNFQDAKRPRTIVKSIGGIFFTEDNKIISKKDVIDLLTDSTEELILKKSTESCGGKGIVFIKDVIKDEVENLLKQYDNDIIIQRMVKQSPLTSVFNRSCLNSFRITTLNLNGVTTVLSRVFKIGAAGLKVDNSGSGGIMIGVDEGGRLDDRGFLANGQMLTSFNNIKFGNIRIPAFNKIEQLAIKLHSRIDHIHIIGWDIALDLKDDPILIEANATWPGITVEQLCTGPIFRERTEEVIEYCKHNKHILPEKVFSSY